MSAAFIYHVSFREPPIEGDPRVDFFFFSLAAIYELFSVEQVGCSVRTLWNARIDVGQPYHNRHCSVRREPVFRKARSSSGLSRKID